jgi:8-oxo-dGTP pyrophosphatase MutT (NUDIX family)
MPLWKTLSRKPVLSFGKWLSVEDRTVETPDEQVIEHWPWVRTPDYVNILAVTREGRFLIFRQGKYGLEGESLAPVGGYIEEGEDPLDAAKRELREETGYEAAGWTSLGTYLVDPNRGVAMGYIYLATGAVQVTEADADDLEEQHLLLMERVELVESLRTGQFKVLAWAAAIALALLWI